MPLHADDAFLLAALYGLYHSVGRCRRDGHVGSAGCHRLVVERVDVYTLFGVDGAEHRAPPDGHRVGGLLSVGVLRVLELHLSMLRHTSAEGDGECLHAAADAEHG